jgi:DNA-binding transcriptional ArsR family regulator
MRRSRHAAGTVRPSSIPHTAPNTAHIFAALGDETRLHLVARLCRDGPLSITKLALGSQISRQAITKHLRMMETAGLMQSMRSGREIIWRIDQERVEEARHYLDQISSQWDEALERLRVLVEKETYS